MNDASRIVLLTGGAGGIGRALTTLLRSEGYTLLVTDLPEALHAAAFAEGPHLSALPLDVRSVEQWQTVLAECRRRFGRLDCCINLAGIIRPGFVLEQDEAAVDLHFDVNLKGVIHGTRLAAGWMCEQGHGHIINISSMAGLAPVMGLSLYSASKFAVRAYSIAAAFELRSRGVYVTTICPDLVDTPMLDLQLDYPDAAALTFSGPPRPLTADAVARAILDAMRRRPLEVALPPARARLAKLGNLFPEWGRRLTARLASTGKSRIMKLRGRGR